MESKQKDNAKHGSDHNKRLSCHPVLFTTQVHLRGITVNTAEKSFKDTYLILK